MRTPNDRERKEALDRQTDYLTFLPHMDEGFHTGYQTTPGVVSDGNQRPREWLESLARNMRTQGREVSYSIPDVLASEQQLRRLSRLKPEEALCHQQMIDFRAVLALLLLWDTWKADASWPKLELSCLSGQATGFSASVTAALSPIRAPEGLWVFTLRSSLAVEGEAHPVALLSPGMAVSPAADSGDLTALLPPAVRWYDRRVKRWMDPCGQLSQADAFLLVSRLRMLQKLCEETEWQSPLHQADSRLVSLLDQFADDIRAAFTPWEETLPEDELRLRVLAAYTLEEGIEKTLLSPADHPAADNLLLRALGRGGLPAPAADTLSLWMFRGVPFAAQSRRTLLQPAHASGEAETIESLKSELSLLEQHDPRWRRDAVQALRTLQADTQSAAGLLPAVLPLLNRWADDISRIPTAASREVTLDIPLSQSVSAVKNLLGDLLGLWDEEIIAAPFSDALLFIDGEAPYDDEALNERCRTESLGFAVPPLSPSLCRFLISACEQDGHYAPMLLADSLSFERQGDTVLAAFTLVRRNPDQGAAPVCAVTFRKAYRVSSRMESGAAHVLPASECPGAAVWPNVRLNAGLWQQYYLFTHQPDSVSAWAWDGDGWHQGALHEAGSDRWQTACVKTFPAFVALKRGELSLGALINDIPRRLIKHEPAASIAIDFGSISTAVMLRQGDRVQPAVLSECLHRTLLKGSMSADVLAQRFLPSSVLLPGAAVEHSYYSLMDLFSDDPAQWKRVLVDGHIFYRSSLEALAEKNASALYYDLKWSEESYARLVMRLFLKQAMVQGALSARLWGSSSMSFCISMPGAMPLHRQESYLEMMRGLAREVSQETGMPLTPAHPSVLYATENQADGLYFLSQSEINARSGYLNLDIGGSTADLSLWLDGRPQAAIECSLLLGCRQMLFDSLLERHPSDFAGDFTGVDDALAASIRMLTETFRTEGSTLHGRRKCMLLLDDLLASEAESLRKAMAQCRANGRISYLESLLLFHIGFLFYLAGDLLRRAHEDETLNPLLPERMEICIAGNGGQLLKAFDEEQHTRLCSLALARIGEEHPLRMLLPVQSRHPKQEAARGLLYDDNCLRSAIQPQESWNGTLENLKPENLPESFLMLFGHVFPQAAQRLLPHLFESGSPAIRGAAAMEMDSVFANESALTNGDEIAMFVRCMEDLKRLWKI